MNRVLINGDDFGMNERCSNAIAKAFSNRLITDTTMMANGAYFDKALSLARDGSFFDRIGIHFNLTEGVPLTEAIKRLPDFVSDGKFHKGYLQHPHALNDAEQKAIFAELDAQAHRLIQSGVKITHADSHHYIHNISFLSPIVAEVCRKNGINRIRLSRTFDTPSKPRVTEGHIDNAWWREQGFVTARHFGRLFDTAYGLIPDLTEIMVHPDFDKDGSLIDRTEIVDSCPTGSSLYSLAERFSITPIGYSELR